MEFEQFAADQWGRLRRTGFLLSGDWHAGEDLAQETLIKVASRWWSIRSQDRAAAFARKALVRTWIDWQRKRSSGELPVDEVQPAAVTSAESGPDDRVLLVDALRRIPPVQRAVLVLRFWEDRSVEETAALLGRKPATVRSDTARGLERMRQLLDGFEAESEVEVAGKGVGR
ncbi:SigE family RNA polymerase sigma factor [Streptacidiphilus jiangxiensis]|uniref:RNA polymerase sigma-70 factor, sigma-E family n=1 Tax=Streptacidiphilus jiangxiensis TaxID=235985 RepID=A0A1H8BQG1_STRJI|nr:SigE family RNA polymerase sigma factor [Streptacidiphilus jiangxiensis]SEM85105.1 RNA polymerase sigma-70 factor, sigma-E family [Streptacidiphilus jiangxiensis]